MRYLAIAVMWGAIVAFLTFVADRARLVAADDGTVKLSRGAANKLQRPWWNWGPSSDTGWITHQDGRRVYVINGLEVTEAEFFRRFPDAIKMRPSAISLVL